MRCVCVCVCVDRVWCERGGKVTGRSTHVPSRCAGCLDPGIHDLAAAVTLVLIATDCHTPHAPRKSVSTCVSSSCGRVHAWRIESRHSCRLEML